MFFAIAWLWKNTLGVTWIKVKSFIIETELFGMTESKI